MSAGREEKLHFDKLGCHTGQKNIYSKDVTTLSIKYMDEGKL